MAARSLIHGQRQAEARGWPPFEEGVWAVFGMGATGRSVASLLLAHGARVRLVDADGAHEQGLRALFPEAELALGPVTAEAFAGCRAVFVSQGVPPDHPALMALDDRRVALFGEVELLARLAPRARVAAVTGTNGKSTTTALLGALVQARVPEAFVGGNLGTPLSAWLLAGAQAELGVLELSSALIDGSVSFAPQVAVVLNVTPDHLERYGSMEAYAHSKSRLVAAVPPGGTAILNADDPLCRAMAPRCPGRVWWFGQGPTLPGDGLRLTERDAVCGVGALASRWPETPMAHARLLGRHNRDNAMAALLAAEALLGPRAFVREAALRTYQQFVGLPHRLELVGTLAGARWLNDSKATNDASAATAVRAVDGPLVLLLGGHDKGGGYGEVVAALRRRPARAVLAFGAARFVIGRALAAAGIPCERYATLEEACERALGLVAVGDAVLLSPACSSFDAFRNYVHRGEWFAGWVAAQAARGDRRD